MLYILLSLAFVLAIFGFGVATSIFRYFYDAKNLRKYENLSCFSGITTIPWVWESIQLRRFRTLHTAHQRAAIIRVAPNILSFNDPRAAADIYGHGTRAVKATYYDAGAGPYKNLADTRDKAEHSQKRRMLASGYALTSVIGWEDKIASRVRALLDQYDSRCLPKDGHAASTASSLDHRRWMDLFTIDLINDIGLSANMRLLEKADDLFEVRDAQGNTYSCRFREMLVTGHEVHTSYAWVPTWYNIIKRLTWWDSRWKSVAAYNDIVTTQCKRRIDRYLAGEKLDDFFTFLLENKNGKMNLLPLGELIAECSVMLNAGSETTGIALTNCLYLLLKNPVCLQRLRREVDQAFEDVENTVLPFEKVRYLPYLRACLDEGLRLHPPSATTTPRMTPSQGQEIMGHWIPGDVTVFCPTYSVQRDPKVFSNPDAFEPERWLGPDAKDLQRSFLPFSAGPRACIGRNITYMEQQMLVAALIHRYDFELMSESWRPVHSEAVTCSPESMPVRIFRRQFQLSGAN